MMHDADSPPQVLRGQGICQPHKRLCSMAHWGCRPALQQRRGAPRRPLPMLQRPGRAALRRANSSCSWMVAASRRAAARGCMQELTDACGSRWAEGPCAAGCLWVAMAVRRGAP